MKKLRCLNEATELYQMTKRAKLPAFMRDQLLRASSSVVLNLSEGNARRTLKDKRRFFNIAYASVREVQTIARLENLKEIYQKADQIGAMTYALTRALSEAVTESETDTETKRRQP
jgi:four helix bundle protein